MPPQTGITLVTKFIFKRCVQIIWIMDFERIYLGYCCINLIL